MTTAATAAGSRTDTRGADRKALAELVFRRKRLVHPEALAAGRGPRIRSGSADSARGVDTLEVDLLRRGYLLSAALRARLVALPAARLAVVGNALLALVSTELGGHVPHEPLFRRFPRHVPHDTAQLYVDRVFALLVQHPDLPCVLCGEENAVGAVNPCGHLVCGRCWPAENYGGCPICHRRTIGDVPFLDPASAAVASASAGPAPARAVLLAPGRDLDAEAYDLLATLLARTTPLSPADRADFDLLLDHVGHDPSWLPARIPVRQTKAVVLARVLADCVGGRDQARFDLADVLRRYVDSATDLLRALYELFGGNADLTSHPARYRTLPRRVRSALLDRLEALPFDPLVEDLHRHAGAWKRLAENLHPFEAARRRPRVALAFAVLRGTQVGEGTFAEVLAAEAAAHPETIRWRGGRYRRVSWAGKVERAMAGRDVPHAVRLLAGRPGELVRRLSALAGRGPEDVDEIGLALVDAAPHVSTAVLLSALGALRAHAGQATARLFLPKGGSALLWTEQDDRPRLPLPAAETLTEVITGELLARAGRLPAHPVGLLDADLTDLVAPFAERSAAKTLVALARGSVRPVGHGRILRLFLHWTEPPGARVDLDLSVALFDASWRFVGLCDYTELRFGKQAAVHSGDLTSAPAPLGASEFVDLDLAELHRLGVRHAVMIVFSFNDVPFEAMTDAFAGYMVRSGDAKGHFDARTVEQRYDLTTQALIAAPLVVDVRESTMRWIDLNLTAKGFGHNVAKNARALARLARGVTAHFRAGARVSMWELACLHAAARCAEVLVRHGGEAVRYRRGAGESVEAFHRRLVHFGPSDGAAAVRPAGFAVLVRGDAPIGPGGEVHALHQAELDAGAVRLLAAADLLALG